MCDEFQILRGVFHRNPAYAGEYDPMRILIVEDESRMLELLRKGLYEHDFTVMTATDGETGLEIATAHEFDALVLDIGLPHLDGYGLMQALRAHGRNTPVLMPTARDSEDEIVKGLDLGADDYLTKLFSFPELVASLTFNTGCYRGNASIAPQFSPEPNAERISGPASSPCCPSRHSSAAISSDADDVFP